MITLMIGGARSGKSSYAETYCLTKTKESGSKHKQSKPAYIATAQVYDQEMNDRVQKHQQRRKDLWDTFEEPYEVPSLIQKISGQYEVILLDCLTLYITNLLLIDFDDQHNDLIAFADQKEELIRSRICEMIESVPKDTDLVIVSNEVGLGIVPENFLSRTFRDISGRMNQLVAEQADQVYFTVAGIPIKIKPELERIIP